MGRFSDKITGKRRKCGSCTACCHVIEIKELGHKPAYSPCPQQVGKGCLIHGDHPKTCRQFKCGWLEGLGQNRHRPDRIGAFMTADQTSFGKIARLHEVVPGALESRAVVDFVADTKLAGKHILVGTTSQGSVVIAGPEPQVSVYRSHLRSQKRDGVETGFIDS